MHATRHSTCTAHTHVDPQGEVHDFEPSSVTGYEPAYTTDSMSVPSGIQQQSPQLRLLEPCTRSQGLPLPPPFDESDPASWARLMQQHLRITGMSDAITADPVFGGARLRARPSDATGRSWEEINGMVLNTEETAAFVRCTDAFTTLTQALLHAPPVFKQLAITIEDGNSKALWEAIKKHIEETRGETGTRLLTKLVSARPTTATTRRVIAHCGSSSTGGRAVRSRRTTQAGLHAGAGTEATRVR